MKYFEELTLKRKLGIIIKANRKEKNLTQDDLATRINCDQSVISRIEMGNDFVDLSNYTIAIEQLGMKFDEQTNLESLTGLINEFWTLYEYEKYDQLSQFEIKINKLIEKNTNILIEYHYGVFMYFFYYYKREHEKWLDVYQYLKDIIYICEEKYQLLFLLVSLHISLLENKMNESKEFVLLLKEAIEGKMNNFKPLFTFFIGNYYFKMNNRTKALNHYLIALTYFEKSNNFVRIFYVKFIMNSLIVRERNYSYAIERYKQLLIYIPYLNDYYIHKLYFRIGYCYYALKEYQQASDTFHIALTYNRNNDVNHIYYYLLNIYDQLDDLHHFKLILSKINYESNHQFGTKIINVFLQKKMHSKHKYYEYIEQEMIPLISEYYEKIEIAAFMLDLLDYYYETQQYAKYHELTHLIVDNLA